MSLACMHRLVKLSALVIKLLLHFRRTPHQTDALLYTIDTIILAFRIENKKRSYQYTITRTGVLVGFSKKHVIKMPLGSESFKDLVNNHQSYRKLKTSSIADVVPYSLKPFKHAFLLTRLSPLSRHPQATNQLLRRLRQFPTRHYKRYTPYFVTLISAQHPDAKRLLKLDWQSYYWETGLMHGDFTTDNIMVNRHKKTALIDLNRLDPIGFPSYDRLHLDLTEEAKSLSQSLTETVEARIVNVQNHAELGDLTHFLLLRLYLRRPNSRTREPAFLQKFSALFSQIAISNERIRMAELAKRRRHVNLSEESRN